MAPYIRNILLLSFFPVVFYLNRFKGSSGIGKNSPAQAICFWGGIFPGTFEPHFLNPGKEIHKSRHDQ